MKYIKLFEEYGATEMSKRLTDVDYKFKRMNPEEIEDYKKSLEVNEGNHGRIIIWGKNEGEEKVKLGYAGIPEAAEDLEKDFANEFDEVWSEDEDVVLKDFI